MSNLLTYRQAKALATPKNAGKVFSCDSGNGWIGTVRWCSWRKRQVWVSVGPNGAHIV